MMKFKSILGIMCTIILSIVCSIVIQQIGYPQSVMMTREQAGQIALQFAEVGSYPGTLHWLTVQDLPIGEEVDESDLTLISQLASQGENWSITKKKGLAGWFGNSGAYEDTYIFHVTFSQFPNRTSRITVNAWTGYCVIEPFRKIGETNEQLGLDDLPVKTFDELRNIAINIAQQILGSGDYDILTVPYSPDKQQILFDYFWGFIIFKVDAQTGAHLPKMVELFLNSRTGWLEHGKLWKRPLKVSTVPNISKDEAKNRAKQFLAQLGIEVTEWLDDGFYGGKILNKDAFPYNAVAGLYVIEDDLLQQFLRWIFIFAYNDPSGEKRYDFISVDAHTGAVIPGASLKIELSFQRQIQLRKMKQKLPCNQKRQKEMLMRRMPNTFKELIEIEEELWQKYHIRVVTGMQINGEDVLLGEPMILFNGRLYLEARYANDPDGFGTQWDEEKRILKGRFGKITIKQTDLFKLPKQARSRGFLLGHLYIPLRRVCEVAGIRLEWDNERKQPILWTK